MPYISLIICTHNPRPDYLQRVLDAFKAQTLPKEQWELLLIDNASKEPLAKSWDLSWHPHARHIREDELGLTPARLRGINESTGELLVFVDDDNVLAEDYLEKTKNLFLEKPKVGVWSGTIVAEFEVIPAAWKSAFLPYLALNDEIEERVSNDIECAPLPIGAGMVIYKEAARSYLEEIYLNSNRASLDRIGNHLLAGGDTDMGIVAIKRGFACGRTPKLQLTHLIPKRRTSTIYLFQIVRDISYSHIMLYRWHGLQRGQVSGRDFLQRLVRCILLAGVGAVCGNANRFGRGMVGISSLYGTWLALRNNKS